MNYQPSVFARSLRSQCFHAIGLIIPDIANPFFPEVVRSIQNTADERGYTVLPANSDWHVERYDPDPDAWHSLEWAIAPRTWAAGHTAGGVR